MRRLPKDTIPNRGFSLVEMLVTMAILLVFMSALLSFYRAQVFAYLGGEAKVHLKESADIGLDFIVKELRLAGSRPIDYPGCTKTPPSPLPSECLPGPMGPGFERLTEATAQSIRLLYDFHGTAAPSTCPGDPNGCPNGCPNNPEEEIYFFYSGGAVMRQAMETGGAMGTATAVVENVPANGFSLQYYAKDGSAIAAPVTTAVNRAKIHRVDVSLTVQRRNPNPLMPGNIISQRSLATVYLRNPAC